MDRLWQDLRGAVRSLSANPGFVIVALLSLGLGIGANTAIFSLINAVMLRALPVANPDRLVLLTDPGSSGLEVDTTENGVRNLLSYPEFEQIRDQNDVFSGIFAAQSILRDTDIFTGRGGGELRMKARPQLVSGEFFGVLGVQPILGRVFTPSEDKTPGANPVAVMSYGFWQRNFGGDLSVLGRTIRIGKGAFQVIGVAPEGFRGILVGADADLWLPITMQEQAMPGRNYLKPRDTIWLQVMARLAPAASVATAEAGINVTFQQILNGWAAALPTEKERRQMLGQKIRLREGAKGASTIREQFGDPLLLLMGMVGLVLLIGCANIANLMLARASARQREIGVRLALGAGRMRLIRQLLTESILVAALGGILGFLLAAWGVNLLLALVSRGVSDLSLDVHRDYSVFVFTAAISLLTGVLFGLAPALRATRVDISRTLSANARGSIGGRGRVQTGRTLVVVQVALSLVLLMGATLFVRSLRNQLAQRLGLDRDHILMVRVDPIAAGYKGTGVSAIVERVRERLRLAPGVRGVTASNTGLFGGDSGDQISLEASPVRDADKLRSRWTLVGPDYFSTMGIPLLRGRQSDASDVARGAQVCVVNDAFAKLFYPNSDPIGRHVTDEYPTTRETYEIVGVAADAREHGLRQHEPPRFYPNLAHPIGALEGVTFLLNSAGDPAAIAPAVRAAIAAVDAGLPVLNLRTLNERIGQRLITQRLIAELSTFFGAAALLLAAIGLYGVMSYSMTRRTGEIGIRMALGASAGSVIRMVLRETLWLVGIGVAIGAPCALGLGRLIANRLFGITPQDPAAIAGAIAIIVAAAILAAYAPARRASRLDPIGALRTD